MSARRAAVMLCAVSALVWAGQLARGGDRPIVVVPDNDGAGLEIALNKQEKPSKEGEKAQSVVAPDSGAQCDSGHCGDCAYGCCCQPIWRFTAGFEATYLDVVLRDVQNIGMNAGPRIWVGAENCNGWGARARYWQIDATEFFVNQPLTTSPSATDTFDQLYHLDLYTIDMEATKRGEFQDWDWLAFFGGRYASYGNQIETDIADTSPVTNNVFVDDIHAQAGGITGGIEASRPIGWGPLELYVGGRVSVLWGDADNFHVARINVSGVQTTQLIGTADRADLTIWEAQIGLQCSKYLPWCHGTVYGRCGFEYQAWNFGNNTNPAIPLSDLDLYGVAASVGIAR